MKETDLSRSVQKAAKSLGVWCIRIQSGRLLVTKGKYQGWVHLAEPGTPDLFLPALGVWLEVKTPTGRLERAQRTWHERARKEGVRVYVVRSVGDAVAVIRSELADREHEKAMGWR